MENLPIYENGELSPIFKRKQAIQRTKAIMNHVAATGQDLVTWLILDPLKRVAAEFSHQMKLEMIDTFYKTNLHAQYKAGKKTQIILAAKRSHGLI